MGPLRVQAMGLRLYLLPGQLRFLEQRSKRKHRRAGCFPGGVLFVCAS